MEDAHVPVPEAEPLGVFWWRGVPNFGDAITPLIVGYVAARPVQHVRPNQAELFAIGSILHVARRAVLSGHGPTPTVWGSGVLMPPRRDFVDQVIFAALRGPITAALLGLEMDTYGDPGLLISEIITDIPADRDRIGIVPHHTLVDDPELTRLLKKDPAYMLIDPRGDPAEICGQIASCAHIFASSLHGLIIADAYGVANTWLVPEGQSWLKYHDYAASIGRSMIAPILLEDVPKRVGKPDQDPSAYADGIARARAALKQTFPASLRAQTPSPIGA